MTMRSKWDDFMYEFGVSFWYAPTLGAIYSALAAVFLMFAFTLISLFVGPPNDDWFSILWIGLVVFLIGTVGSFLWSTAIWIYEEWF